MMRRLKLRRLIFIFFNFGLTVLLACNSAIDYVVSASSGYSSLSIFFRGTNQDLSIADHADFNFGTQFSVFVWVNSSSGLLSAGERVISQFAVAGNQRGWALSVGSTKSHFEVFISQTGGNGAGVKKVYESSVNGFDGSWHLIGFTFNNGTLKLYVDGVEDTTPTKSFDAAITTLFDSTASLRIGDDDTTGAYFTGYIDEPALYSIELTGAQVAAIYNLGSPINLSSGPASGSLVSWWRMGDASGDNIGTTNQIIDVMSGHNAATNNMISSDIVTFAP